MKFNFKDCLNTVNSQVLRRIGEDLRKGGYLIGLALVGFVMPNDNISLFEGAIILSWGILSWIIGHYMIYHADKADKSKQPRGESE